MAVNPVPVAVDDAGATVNVADAMPFFAFFGTAASGSPTAANTPKTITAEGDVEEFFLGGPICELARTSVGYSRQGGVCVRLEEDAAGAYGAVELGDFTGTAVPTADATAVPINDHEIVVEFPDGGVPGTSGITYRYGLAGVDALGNIREPVSRKRHLGTSTVITVYEPGSTAIVARFTLLPPSAQVTALVNLVIEIRTERLDHYALGAGTHNSADVTSGVGIGVAPTDLATAIARLNEIRTADLLHAANAVAHNSADTTSYASIPAAATDAPTAIALAIFLKGATTVHNTDVVAHDGADPATIAAADPTNGTVVTDDRFECPTSAPTFNAAAITAAFNVIKDYTENVYTTIVIRGQILPAYWSALIAGRSLLAAAPYDRPTTILCETRLPTDGESDTAFRVSLDTTFDGDEDPDIYRCANYGRFDHGDITQLRGQYRRTELVPFAARLQALDYGASPALVQDIVRSAGSKPSVFGGRLEGFRVSEAGALIGHDERFQPGLREAGFGTLCSYSMKPAADVYIHDPKTAAPAGNRAPNLRQRRIIVAVILRIMAEAVDLVGSVPAFEPGRTTLRSDIADAIDGRLNDAVRTELGSRVDSFTFAVDRNATISLQDTIIPWTARVTIAGEILELPGTLSVNKV